MQIFRSRTALRRVVGDAPIFGMHYSLAKPGSVSVGDKVLVAPAAVAAVVVVVAGVVV